MAASATPPSWLARVCADTSEAPRLYRRTAAGGRSVKDSDDSQKRIYIVGAGNLGRLFAAALARRPDPPPITLVVHRAGLLTAWAERPGLLLHPPGYMHAPAAERAVPIVDGVDVEMWGDADEDQAEEAEVGRIANLIVATKAQDALPTVDRLRRYLAPDACVAFAQNGMNKLWPPYGAVYNQARFSDDDGAHPTWVACVVTHGVFSLGPYESVHASPADVVMGSVSEDDSKTPPPYLVEAMLGAAVLNARWVPRPQLWVMQVEKLVVNAVINPLTALLRCQNGVLFGYAGEEEDEDKRAARQGAVLRQVIDRLLQEASGVLTALAVHEMRAGGVLGTSTEAAAAQALVDRLSFAQLRAMVYRVGGVVRNNTSSMLQDVTAGKGTEVRDFNGWLVDMAHYLASVGGGDGSIDVTAHQTIIDLVESGQQLSQEQLGEAFKE